MVHDVADELTACLLLAVRLVVCALVLADPALAGAQTLRGTVRDEVTREAVPAAEVILLRGDSAVRSVYSDGRGRYRMQLPFAGVFIVRVARLGFAPHETLVDASANPDLMLGVFLTPAVVTLPTDTVVADATRLHPMHDAFGHRRRMGLGVYLTRRDIEARGSPPLPHLLREIAGVNLVSDGRRAATPRMSRSAIASRCHPVLYMDGQRMHRFDDPPGVIRTIYESIPTTTIEGVEIYRGRSELPAEFSGPDVRCGAIIIWTRRATPR
jgi:hypothetical protein